MKRLKGTIRTVICVVVVMLTLSVSVLGCNKREAGATVPSVDVPTVESSTQAESVEASTATEVPETTAPGEPIPAVDRQSELAEAKGKNADTAAWLYIPGVDVDDPIVQAADNGYYLHLDENGRLSWYVLHNS